MTAVTLILVAAVFAGASFLGIELSAALGARATDEHEIRPMSRAVVVRLVLAGAFFGVVARLGGSEWQALAMAAVVCVSLIGCWHSAAVYGRIPDFFTLVPLAAVTRHCAGRSR